MSITTGKPLSISRILVGDPRVITQPDGVLVPVIDVRVLAENGAFFGCTFIAFGLDTKLIRSAWEREPEKFLKVDLNASQSRSQS